jgi:hypothetical protein
MKIENPSGDPDCHKPQYSVRFEPREVEDLKVYYPRAAFDRVRQISEFNESLYRTFASPFARAIGTPWMAELLKWLHPMRTSRYLLSETLAPWMRGMALLAAAVARNRHPLAKDHPLIEREREAAKEVSGVLEKARVARDAF